jgi:cytochrome c
MPWGDAQSLTDDEAYSITAFLLGMNGIIDEDMVLDRESFKTIEMPNQPNFVDDPRPDVRNVACMENCGEELEIVSWASKLDVTPGADGSLDNDADDVQQAERPE